jgi:hypothetical protein
MAMPPHSPSTSTVDEANALVAQEPYPSVPVRRLLNELPPLQARPVEVGIEPALPFLIVCEPAPDQRRKLPRQRRVAVSGVV